MSKRAIDERWPHQVAIPNSRRSDQHRAIVAFCKGRDQSPRGHSYIENGDYQDVLCFGKEDDARAFAEQFDGKIIDPKTRPKWPGRG